MIGMVILNYNDWVTVYEYLKLVTNYNVIDKIVVVDNCSTDDSWNKFQKLQYNNVTYVKSKTNNGYSAGNNVGIRYLLDTYKNLDKIIISNPDINITQEDLIQIINAVNDTYVITTGLVYNSNKSETCVSLASNWGWKVPLYKDMLCNCFLSTYKISRNLLKKGIYYNIDNYNNSKYIDVEAVPGCFFVISKDFIEKINLFDEITFLFGEENILGFQVKERNKKIRIINNTKILHKQSTSINKSIKRNQIKNRYLLDSYDLYMKEYLHCNKFEIVLYHVIFQIGLIEKKILTMMLNI